jgi:hypothetical protein
MTKRQILTAAIVTVGGFGLISLPASAEDNASAAQPSAAQPSAAQPSAAQPSAGQPSAGQSSSSSGLSGSAQTAGSSAGATASASQSDVSKALSQLTNAVLSKDGLKNLSQQISSKDAQRIGDLSQQQAQVDQAADQLRQAFKDKYQKDLDLSQNADQVFTAQFFQMGGSASDSARQASGSLPPDQGTSPSASPSGSSGTSGTSGSASSGTSGTSGASGTGASAGANVGASGASGTANIGGASVSGNVGSSGATGSVTGDAAQTASSSMGGTTITIPASHGMPDARVRLTQESGQWKIQLPQSTDGNQLAQNIQKQLQQCAQMKDQWPADATQAQQAIAHSVLLAFSDQSSSGGASGASGTSGTSGSSSSLGTSGSAGGASGASGASGTSGSSSGTGAGGSSSGTGATGTGGGTSGTPGQ